jgi:hypothetical protein
LHGGIDNPVAHGYLYHYISSPQGQRYREKIHEALQRNGVEQLRPLFYPLNLILHRAGQEGRLKKLPLQVLAMTILGALIFVVRDWQRGIPGEQEQLSIAVAGCCWDAVRSSGEPSLQVSMEVGHEA